MGTPVSQSNSSILAPNTMEVDEDLQTLLLEQKRELTEAQAIDSDLHFAYQLQMQEAVTASLSQNGGGPSSSNPIFELEEVPELFYDETARLMADEISLYEQQLNDRMVAENERKNIRDDLSRRMHDRAFARELQHIPDEVWQTTGDHIQKPYLEGTASGTGVAVGNADSFRVYVKGLMANDPKLNTFVGGIGVAVCDMNDSLVFEVSKGVFGAEMSAEVVEVKSLIEGLHVATTLGLERILIVADSNLIRQCLTGKGHPRQGNLTTLVDQVPLLQKNLAHCQMSLVAPKDVKFALKLAQDAVASSAGQLQGNIRWKTVIETCAICLEDISMDHMFLIDGCLHCYCFSCMRRHVEVKLLHGTLPKCPHEQCKSQLKSDDCKTFLTPELFEMMSQRILEASIPPSDKLYCPYNACSALMSKSEFTHSGGLTLPMIMCKKCDRPFCIDCKVIWHENMPCALYKKMYPNPYPEDAQLKTLAATRRWRQCGKCNTMVSLAEGCNHIYCRCGHEFCYICGAAWVNKKARCTCPLWDERNIIYG